MKEHRPAILLVDQILRAKRVAYKESKGCKVFHWPGCYESEGGLRRTELKLHGFAKFARGKSNPALQLKSLEYLALFGGKESRQVLADVKMYANEREKEIRKKVIEALFLQGNAKAIVDIARKETDPELKKKAVEQLSIMNSKEGAEFFEEILK